MWQPLTPGLNSESNTNKTPGMDEEQEKVKCEGTASTQKKKSDGSQEVG